MMYFVPPLPDIEDAPWLDNSWANHWGDFTRFTPKLPWDGLTPPPGQPEGMDKLMAKNRRDFKRDKVYGMCAVSRRAHRSADKRRWHRPPSYYADAVYSREAHVEAYAKALGIPVKDAETRIAHQTEVMSHV